jgi:hypothetical protein
VDDLQRELSSISGLFASNHTFKIPERDDISPSAFDFLNQAGTATSKTSDDPPLEWGDPSTMASSAATSISFLPRREMAEDDPTTWDVTMHPASRNIMLEDIVAAGMQVLLFNRSSPSSNQNRLASAMPSFILPSPYLNTLDIPRTRTLAACLHNARSIGLTFSDVIKPSCIAPSLFYRPHSSSEDPASLLVSNPSIPAHLRPTLPQIIYQHPAYLDLIPIPRFRMKVILTAVKRGWEKVGVEELDLFELKRDIFEDGLAWENDGSSDKQEGRGQPWDMRSWKASGWFVRKWKGLVDDAIYVNS